MSEVRIVHGDCQAFHFILEDIYDAMIVDPPYSAYVHANTTSQSAGGGTRHNDLGFVSLTRQLRRFIAACAANVRKWSIIYSDIEGLAGWRQDCEECDATYIRAMPWVRWSSPCLNGDRPPQGFELVTAYWGTQRGRKHWNGPGNLTHLAHKCLRGEGKHKTEKPLDQALDLVSWFTDPGDRVLDPCAGSGTVGLACKILGRGYVGYEIDKDWAEKAEQRILTDKLTERDQERWERWKESQEVEWVESEKRRKNTAKSRAKLEALRAEKKAAKNDSTVGS